MVFECRAPGRRGKRIIVYVVLSEIFDFAPSLVYISAEVAMIVIIQLPIPFA